MKHIGTFFDNEQTCIQTILTLHNNGKPIDLDPMFSKGNFYKNTVVKPLLRFDLHAREKGYDAQTADACCLPVEDGSIECMILDPPFLFGSNKHTGNNRLVKRYTMFDTFSDLKKCYVGILNEAYRVLRKNGLLIFKCQDYTDGQTTMTHCLVWLWATCIGFYAKDLAILNLPMPKLYNSNFEQRHLRKTHCYFWVFRKSSRDKIGPVEIMAANTHCQEKSLFRQAA